MKSLIKKLLNIPPRPVRTVIVFIREWWWQTYMSHWEKTQYPNLPKLEKQTTQNIQNIIIYQVKGLTHGGTAKNLQLIANGLADQYKVFFMCGDKHIDEMRKATLDRRITFIPFSYDTNESAVPHKLTGMQPHLKEVIAEHDIDLIITASPGYAHYPWNVITEVPIVLSNVFGAPALQKNIAATIFMSESIRKHATTWIPDSETFHTHLLPIAKPAPENVRDLGRNLRTKLQIPKDDFVFGRIGRDDDRIFDPIGIRAWQRIAYKYPQSHFLVMAPPPVLAKIVTEENIPRVHFLPPSGDESDVWAFHGALDAMAHFRKDGETSGMAIAESLVIGNPVITHRSYKWNAHLGYLTDECSKVAPLDDADTYADFMRTYITEKTKVSESWEDRCRAARAIGEKYFLPTAYMENIKNIIRSLDE